MHGIDRASQLTVNLNHIRASPAVRLRGWLQRSPCRELEAGESVESFSSQPILVDRNFAASPPLLSGAGASTAKVVKHPANSQMGNRFPFAPLLADFQIAA